jgi:hypothetical protein
MLLFIYGRGVFGRTVMFFVTANQGEGSLAISPHRNDIKGKVRLFEGMSGTPVVGCAARTVLLFLVRAAHPTEKNAILNANANQHLQPIHLNSYWYTL